MFQRQRQSQYETETEIQSQHLLALMKITDNSRRKLNDYEESRGLRSYADEDIQEVHEDSSLSFEPSELSFEPSDATLENKQQDPPLSLELSDVTLENQEHLVARPISSSEPSCRKSLESVPYISKEEHLKPDTSKTSRHLVVYDHPDYSGGGTAGTADLYSFAEGAPRVLSDSDSDCEPNQKRQCCSKLSSYYADHMQSQGETFCGGTAADSGAAAYTPWCLKRDDDTTGPSSSFFVHGSTEASPPNSSGLNPRCRRTLLQASPIARRSKRSIRVTHRDALFQCLDNITDESSVAVAQFQRQFFPTTD